MGRMSKEMREVLESGIFKGKPGAHEAVEQLVEEFEFNSATMGGEFEQQVLTSIRHIHEVDEKYMDGQILQEMEGLLMSILALFNEAMEPMFHDTDRAAKQLLSTLMSSMLLVDAIGSVKEQLMKEATR